MTSLIALAAADVLVQSGLRPISSWCANAAGTASAIAETSVTLRAEENAFVTVTEQRNTRVAEVHVYRLQV